MFSFPSTAQLTKVTVLMDRGPLDNQERAFHYGLCSPYTLEVSRSYTIPDTDS